MATDLVMKGLKRQEEILLLLVTKLPDKAVEKVHDVFVILFPNNWGIHYIYMTSGKFDLERHCFLSLDVISLTLIPVLGSSLIKSFIQFLIHSQKRLTDKTCILIHPHKTICLPVFLVLRLLFFDSSSSWFFSSIALYFPLIPSLIPLLKSCLPLLLISLSLFVLHFLSQ